MIRKKPQRWLGWMLVLLLATTAIFLGRPLYLWLNAWFHDRPVMEHMTPGYADDASRMNRTRVAEVWTIPAEPSVAEFQLRGLLNRARTARLRVAIAGARHSMGGHVLYPDGIVLDMLPFKHLELDVHRRILHAGAGARWSEIIPYLDSRGFSVAVMQSNNDFSVGGSISVNCHGWQHNRPPIASTVESLRLMKADGTIVKCSRTENAELFSLVLGGYGLFGIILDVALRVVPNECCRPDVQVLPSDQYVSRFARKVNDAPNVGMVYGRLCVIPGERTFLRQAILTVFRQLPCKQEEIPALKSPGYGALRRAVYRAQIDSQAGKELRWKTEKILGEQIGRKYFSRNQLLNEAAEVYQEQNAKRTDILHEYFIPPDHFLAFLERARMIIPKSHCDLLNVTVRSVQEDRDTFLRYADRDVFSFVMLFSQLRTTDADQRMETMTRQLVDAANQCGGRYYLPYRGHASKAQFYSAYPQANAFFTKKRTFDSEEIFQNQFYLTYGRP